MDYGLLIMDYGFLIMDYGFLIMDYGLLIMDYGLFIMDYGFIAKIKFEVQLDCPSVTQWDVVITFAAEVRF